MSTPSKESDTKDVVNDEGHLKDDNQHSVDVVQNDHDMASPQSKGDSKSSHPKTPTEQDTSPTLPKQSSDDADTNSTLSGVPSPSVTHRPSSSKTSLDDRHPSPSNTSEKQTETSSDAHKGEDPKPDLDASTAKQPMAKEDIPDRKEMNSEPSEPLSLSKKVATVLELNSELLRVYNDFHSQNQIHAFPTELREYSQRIHSNVTWLMQCSEALGQQLPMQARVSTPITTPPPPIPFSSTERINAIYTQMPSFFEKEIAREQRKRQIRQMIASGMSNMAQAATNPTMNGVAINVNGKRERPEDMTNDSQSGDSDGNSPRKRVDTGESKANSVSSIHNTPSPANLHASPTRSTASPSTIHAPGAHPAVSTPATSVPPIHRPSSAQSNSSQTAVQMPPPPGTSVSDPGTPSVTVNGVPMSMSGMTPQQIERMRLMQHNRVRTLSGGNATPHMMPPSKVAPPNLSMKPPQTPQQYPGGHQPQQPAFPNTRAPPAAIFPQLINMIQNPQAHQSVQALHAKIPGFKNMPLEQQASVLWSFQQNQVRHQQQQRSLESAAQAQAANGNTLAPRPAGAGPGPGMSTMPDPAHGFPPGSVPPGMMGGMAPGAGMRPPNPAGVMQPPPTPQTLLQLQQLQQQRQLNLLQQQQQHAAMGRAGGGFPPGAGLSNPGMMGMGGMGAAGNPMAMNPGLNMGMGVGNMGGTIGLGPGGMPLGTAPVAGSMGHTRMPSNPAMGPPPLPMSAPGGPPMPIQMQYAYQQQQRQQQQMQQQQMQQQQMQQQQLQQQQMLANMNGMTTGVNPMNLSFSPQQHQQPQQHQTPNATMMQLPNEHSPMGILQSMPPSANHQSPTHHPSPSHSQSGMGMMASSPTNAEAVMPSASTPTPLTPSAIMQQRAASMERASPAPGTPASSGNMSMDPNMVVNWQDLTAT